MGLGRAIIMIEEVVTGPKYAHCEPFHQYFKSKQDQNNDIHLLEADQCAPEWNERFEQHTEKVIAPRLSARSSL
jgi:hypothetical protein